MGILVFYHRLKIGQQNFGVFFKIFEHFEIGEFISEKLSNFQTSFSVKLGKICKLFICQFLKKILVRGRSLTT